MIVRLLNDIRSLHDFWFVVTMMAVGMASWVLVAYIVLLYEKLKKTAVHHYITLQSENKRMKKTIRKMREEMIRGGIR